MFDFPRFVEFTADGRELAINADYVAAVRQFVSFSGQRRVRIQYASPGAAEMVEAEVDQTYAVVMDAIREAIKCED